MIYLLEHESYIPLRIVHTHEQRKACIEDDYYYIYGVQTGYKVPGSDLPVLSLQTVVGFCPRFVTCSWQSGEYEICCLKRYWIALFWDFMATLDTCVHHLCKSVVQDCHITILLGHIDVNVPTPMFSATLFYLKTKINSLAEKEREKMKFSKKEPDVDIGFQIGHIYFDFQVYLYCCISTLIFRDKLTMDPYLCSRSIITFTDIPRLACGLIMCHPITLWSISGIHLQKWPSFYWYRIRFMCVNYIDFYET